MNEIPEDVREAAEKLAAEVADYDMAYHGVVEVVARAIMAERERCQNIARFYAYTSVFNRHKNLAVAGNASQNIADMIDGRLEYDGPPATPITKETVK